MDSFDLGIWIIGMMASTSLCFDKLFSRSLEKFKCCMHVMSWSYMVWVARYVAGTWQEKVFLNAVLSAIFTSQQ